MSFREIPEVSIDRVCPRIGPLHAHGDIHQGKSVGLHVLRAGDEPDIVRSAHHFVMVARKGLRTNLDQFERPDQRVVGLVLAIVAADEVRFRGVRSGPLGTRYCATCRIAYADGWFAETHDDSASIMLGPWKFSDAAHT
jgi:hypothetical protein